MSGLRIAVIDYEAGNLRSVEKALQTIGASPTVTSNPAEILAADAVVFPGQGRCDAAMNALNAKGLTEVVKQYIRQGKPFFGVCVGMQLLLDSSEEGEVQCLGIVPGRVRKFAPGLKVPHMGWNQVAFNTSHPVFAGVPQNSYFYFVHSYYPDPKDQSWTAGTTEYGVEFCCAVAKGNVVATQFHPEKSGPVGLSLYANFVKFASRVTTTH